MALTDAIKTWRFAKTRLPFSRVGDVLWAAVIPALLGIAVVPASASQSTVHCPDTPVVVLNKPSPGISTQETCFKSLELCYTDTFYQEDLEADIYSLYNGKSGSAFANIDSVEIWWQEDTTYFSNGIVQILLNQYEKVWLRSISNLKGTFPDSVVILQDKWLFLPQSPEMTYAALIDTPLVVFYDSIKSLRNLGIGPVDGCYFEPTAHIVTETGIQKMGNDRFPGLSLPTREFLQTIGREDVEDPFIKKEKQFSLDWGKNSFSLEGNLPIRNLKLINLRGQIIHNLDLNGSRQLDLPLNGLPAGIYAARITGDGWVWQNKLAIHYFPNNEEWTITVDVKNGN